jgi:CRISPR/Cas system-associated endonuclease/helicase Cas3
VVDECYMYLDSTSNFRYKMKNVGYWLSSAGIPRVILTATLPASEEKNLFQLLNIDKKKVALDRRPTTRHNFTNFFILSYKQIHLNKIYYLLQQEIKKEVSVDGHNSGKIIVY